MEEIVDAKDITSSVDRYTERRRVTLNRLLNQLIENDIVNSDKLDDVRDLGCYQGSSSMAWKDNGATRVVGIDQSGEALNTGLEAGYLTEAIESDMVNYVKENLEDQFSGTVSAFNCILYLPEDRIWELFSELENKFSKGSQMVFTFSKSQEEWINKFKNKFDESENWITQHEQGLTTGELDYNAFVITRK